MATNNDMRARLGRLEGKVDQIETKVDQIETKVGQIETKLDQLEKKVDLLPTKADLEGFATKADLVVFTDEIKNHMGIMLGHFKETVRNAAEGYGATLERIERDLREMNQRFDVKFGDHDGVLTNHNQRITALETHPR